MRILIIDDEKSIRTTLQVFLEREGFAVDTAETAVQARNLIQATAYDILITDIILPNVSGVEFLEEIRQKLPDVPVLMMTGQPTVETAVTALQLGAFDYLYKPIDKATLVKTVKQAVKVRELALQKEQLEEEKLEYQHNLEDTVSRRTADLDKSMQSTIKIMTSLVDSRDPYTSGHQIRVGNLSARIALELGMSQFAATGIRVTGYLHDLGKLALPSEILVKPSKLSRFEFEIVKTHAECGYNILRDLRLPWPVALIIYQHHERLDGSGYPQGLSGDQILMESRILTVADVVEAMASHRPYRASLGLDAALAEVEQFAGTYYDPDVVQTCSKLLRDQGYEFENSYQEASFISYH